MEKLKLDKSAVEMPSERIQAHLQAVYGIDQADSIWPRMAARLDAFRAANPATGTPLEAGQSRYDERDVVLITYGDQIQEAGKPPLQSLDETLTTLVGDTLNTVHILPFYPYTSDDGFSVVDYREVNPDWGDWSNVSHIGENFHLMFDAVINHISQASRWFQGFLRGEQPYTGYFLAADADTDLSQVVRPRTAPLLTPYQTALGTQHVWTTFSADQVDLNYASSDLLIEIVDLLLFYVEMGARLIRLDAIAFMWKEVGTTCLHLPQTHHLIQLMRSVLDAVAPKVMLVTETNVPHVENISYFGDGANEAQMVYNFTLPPLTVHAFHSGDARRLTSWATTLATTSDQTTFFNFMASHDGIGLRPVEGILTPAEVESLAEKVEAHGGYISYKANEDGSQSPYELNVVYFDALNDPGANEPQSLQVDRFMASQAILLSLSGVPGIYVHSLFGSRNWRAGVAETGRNRTVNRRKFRRSQLEQELADPSTISHQVFACYRKLIRIRTAQASFHPNGHQQIIKANPSLFCLARTALDASGRILCIHNVSGHIQRFDQDLTQIGIGAGTELIDLLSENVFQVDRVTRLVVEVAPYGVLWLREERAG